MNSFITKQIGRQIRRSFPIFIACWLFWSVPGARALQQESAEYPVKLAVLYNFAQFVEWPPDSYRDPRAAFAICVVGHDPFGANIKGELQGRTVGGHPVEFRSLRSNDIPSVCHIVFVPVTEKGQEGRIVGGLNGSSTLTVGETEGFAMRGGMINLTVEENKIRFEINQLAAERAGLKISSKLLSIGKIVKL